MSVLTEETSTQATLDRVEEIEDVALTSQPMTRAASACLASPAPN
jgi:hypothetical protein